MKEGYYSLVLHAHLPYVRHEEDHRLEQNWLFEAITESYIPLLDAIDRSNVTQAVTISLSPPLMEMLADSLLKKRYLNYLKNTEKLLKKEQRFKKQHNVTDQLLDFYRKRYALIRDFIKKWEGNILDAFVDLHQRGIITCITSSATHTFLPYLMSEEGVRLQIQEGIYCFEKYFGSRPGGFWVPECAFNERVDKILAEEGIRYTFVDEHALLSARPIPDKRSGAPVFSQYGVALFPRHTVLSAQVWSSTDGYPGDDWYREFYRDVAYEREWSYIKPHMHPEGIRLDTGLKFNRITGSQEKKDHYEPKIANHRAKEHADHFIHKIVEQIENFGDQSFPPYLMMTPFDAELFGHWWFEGPTWIEYLLTASVDILKWTTPEQYLEMHHRDLQSVNISFTTWGRDGYGSVWLNESNSWIYPIFHQMEETLLTLSKRFENEATDYEQQIFKQLLREWMLATSSDWAFIMDGDTASQYAESRLREHKQRFEKLLTSYSTGTLSQGDLTKAQRAFPFLKELRGSAFLHETTLPVVKARQNNEPVILMLSWEYPPVIAGGLSIHVYELAQALSKKGYEVHVLTSHVSGQPDYQEEGGVFVHRVQSLQPEAASFDDWIGGLNFAMVKAAEELAKYRRIDVIHAHDWLVGVAAIGLKHKLSLPLLATIHATEYGRNKGVLSSRQKLIQTKELRLMQEAKRIIVCSESMRKELTHYYLISKVKILIIPNASRLVQSTDDTNKVEKRKELDVFCFGRLVPEKGFQYLLEALHLINDRVDGFHVSIAGEGPYKEMLLQKVQEYKLTSVVTFVGFMNPDECLMSMQRSDIVVVPSLYEPFGLSALEAMSAGKAVIASKVGGLEELISHHHTGIHVPPGDAKCLAQELEKLLEHPEDISRLGQKAKAYANETFNWKRTAELTSVELTNILTTKSLSVN
ncbi:1,4-alpha-glucan branching protein domain-containing protein [Alkalicoccobacillus murimartini]|uniref:1,4-alpha-glucan branching enzyme n=1 Tax=Alkalicoccobacillus murimartini TaxID=171685 RepID=A0ABT9YD80_9BACI|nr:1,4-alpha-glucan branching protein domain-containing protein [Alkalicoccobacillus murimartini]MDQ0205588.1 1,4-alpha-glucan branching enzyme [Alkalicoccobacillus murimartini]